MSTCTPRPLALAAPLHRAGIARHVALTCPELESCEDLAARLDWPGMSCRACPGFSGLAVEGSPFPAGCLVCGDAVAPNGTCVRCGIRAVAEQVSSRNPRPTRAPRVDGFRLRRAKTREVEAARRQLAAGRGRARFLPSSEPEPTESAPVTSSPASDLATA